METLTSTVTANNAKKYTAEGFSRLANAIVIKAASDYRIALRCDIKHRKCPKGVDRIELEHFFTSSWYESLTDVDGGHSCVCYRKKPATRIRSVSAVFEEETQ